MLLLAIINESIHVVSVLVWSQMAEAELRMCKNIPESFRTALETRLEAFVQYTTQRIKELEDMFVEAHDAVARVRKAFGEGEASEDNETEDLSQSFFTM